MARQPLSARKVSFRIAFSAALLVRALPAAGAEAQSPTVKGPWSQRVTANSALIRVEVLPPSSATFEIGPASSESPDAAARTVIASGDNRAIHSVVLQNLRPETRYVVTVKAREISKTATFTTAPPDDSGRPFRFLIYGDNRTDDASHAAVVKAMTAVPTDLLIHTGDFVERGASSAQWQKFFEIEVPLLRERCLFSSVGNHELVDGAGVEYVRYFGPANRASVPLHAPVADRLTAAIVPADTDAAAGSPEQLMGTHRWSNVRFFFLNGMVDHRVGQAREWLKNALSDSWGEPGIAWRIVVVHHGPWSSGPHGGNQRLHAADIPALLRTHKVDLVVSGHDHIYERGMAGELPYLVSGGGGAPLYPVKAPEGTSRHFESVRHFIEASVSREQIQFTAVRSDGSTVERCALRKNAGWDCDPKELTARGPSAVGPPVETAAPAKARCGCRTVGDGGPGFGREELCGLACAVCLLARRRLRRR